MSGLCCWQVTRLPVGMIKILEDDISVFEYNMQDSEVPINEKTKGINRSLRNSKNVWIPTEHWISGWLWYYISKVNRENFRYNITDIDNGQIQYTHYSEGDYYHWHQDGDINSFYSPSQIVSSSTNVYNDYVMLNGEYVRKLSFTLQLSEESDYEGGDVQFLDNSGGTFFAPKQRGTLIVFDSRVRHRVRKIKSGVRKSLVGWIVGPRWN